MAFMRKQIMQGDFYLVDGANGTDLIPGDLINLAVLGLVDTAGEITSDDCSEKAWHAITQAIRDYTGKTEIYSVERCAGFYGRYSAPGYTDATAWTWGDTEAEVSEALTEMFGEENEQ